MDIFKAMGIKVGDRSLIREEKMTVAKSIDNSLSISKKGSDICSRERLEKSLESGLIKSEGLENTHGEMFHKDNDKEVEKLQKELKEVCGHKSEVFSAINDLIKSDSKKKDLIKGSGEGSRGGKVIGRTKSGHPIYEKHLKEAMKHHHSGVDNLSEAIDLNRKAKEDEHSDAAHTLRHRALVKEVAYGKHGLLGNHKTGRVTMKDIAEHGPSKGHKITEKSLDDSDLIKGRYSKEGKATGELKKKSLHDDLDDLIKAKYVKRERKGGKWVYYYKNPDGSLRTGEKGSIDRKQQAQIRRERTAARGGLTGKNKPLDQTGVSANANSGGRYELTTGKAGEQNKKLREKIAAKKEAIHQAVGKQHLEGRAEKKKSKETHKKNSHHEKISSAHKELSDLEKKGWHGTPEHAKAESKHLNAIQSLANNLAHPIKDPQGHQNLLKELHAAGADKKKIKEAMESYSTGKFKDDMADHHRGQIESKEKKIAKLKKQRKGLPLNKQRELNKEITKLKKEVDSHWKNTAHFSKSEEEFLKGGAGSGRRTTKQILEMKEKYKKWGNSRPWMVPKIGKETKREITIKRKSELDEIFDMVKAAPKGVNPDKHERCVKKVKKQGHDVGSAYAICTSSMKKKSFVASYGPGGMVMDFGDMTGNPIADSFTKALQDNYQPEQMSVAKSQAKSYRNALKDFVKKGKDQFEYEKNSTKGDGQVAKGWNEQFHNVDQQTAQALQRGEINVENNMVNAPNVANFNKSEFEQTQTVIGGKLIKAQSETDVELIKLMSQNMAGDTGGTIVEAGGGGVTFDMDSGVAFDASGSEIAHKSEAPVPVEQSTEAVPSEILTL